MQFLSPHFRVAYLFCSLLSITQASPAYSASCSGSFQENSGSDRGVKVKNFCIDYKSSWDIGKEAVEIKGASNFCLIAYEGDDIATDCEYRKMKQARISIPGNSKNTRNSQFVLGETIPITIKLFTVDDGSSTEFKPNKKIPLNSRDGECICNDYLYNLEVSVKRSDIIDSGFTGAIATGNFELIGSFPSGKPSGSIPFVIELELIAAIQISGLKNMDLSKSNEQKFCVFAVGTEKFSLEAESTNGNSENFMFNSFSDPLSYTMTVRDGKQSNTYQKNNSGEISGWQASNKDLCNDHTSNNMTLTINMNDKNPAAGVYTDTMTLTVTPN